MILHSSIQVAALSLLLGAKLAHSQVTTNCPLLGPIFPAPTAPATANAVESARSSFSGYLDDLITAGTTKYGALDTQTTSFSINIFSAHDKTTLFSYHYAAPGLNGSLTSGELNDDTIYRIGSLSKVLSVYAYLAEAGDAILDHPVTRYVPELAYAVASSGSNDIHSIRWDEITLRALGSHISGIPRDYSLLDVANLGLTSADLASLGLPELNSSEVPTCGVSSETAACTRKEFLKGITNSDPLFSTFNTPVYSNAAFQILTYALEAVTQKSFSELVNGAIVQPLDLTRTFLTLPPSNSNAIIPFGDAASFWNFDIGDAAPAGGIYSTMNDLATLGRSILSSSILSPASTRRWMKPHTHTSSVYTSVGMPWEIQRMEIPLTNSQTNTRIVDLYTKAGDIGAYGGYMVLSPDHDFGFSIFAAGAAAATESSVLADVIAATWVPAFEAAAQEQAQALYAGTYVSTEPGLNSSITLTLDDRPGLGVTTWISNNTDFLTEYGALPIVGAAPGQTVSVRLYPSGLQSGNKMAFRALFDVFPAPVVGKVMSMNCLSWVTAASVGYGKITMMDFVVEVDAMGKAVSLSPRALRTVLERKT